MNLFLKLLPLILFMALAAFLAKGLTLDPAELPSPLIDKAAPVFSVAKFPEGSGEFNSAELDGQVWVLNVWASWCGPCVQEHPQLLELAKQSDVTLVGLNYKDKPQDAQPWLARLGNPYTHLLDDRMGDVGLDWGVYGVPETFIVDHNGRVRYKHVGPISPQDLKAVLIPTVNDLQKAAAAS